jgi:hypothetical protein
MKESTPLKWPGNWPRVLPEHRVGQSSWKKPQSFYLDQLELELKRMKVIEREDGGIAASVTSDGKGARDTGVAVWFSRTKKEDFTWRETLGLYVAYPTLDDVGRAYRPLAAKYHTEGSSGDLEMFLKVTRARDAASSWVNQRSGNSYNMAIACDKFNEARLNIASLWQSIKHIRGLERCGTSALMEKTFEGFAQLTEGVHATASH